MKRFFIFLITLLLVLVQAEAWTITYATTTPLSCSINQYSVERIVKVKFDPSVSTSPLVPEYKVIGCYNENQFTQAIDFMNTQAVIEPNVVVRHQASNSPLKIVAADRAMAYSQNYTYLNQVTVNLTKDKAQTIPYTYINQSNPLYYYNTQVKSKSNFEVILPSDLVSEININGARSFIALNAIDIIPLIYVENRPTNCTTETNKLWCINHKTRSLDVVKDNFIRPNITQYIVSSVSSITKSGTLTFRQIRIQVDTAIYVNSYELGIAPDWLQNGTYYSTDGVTFYTDMDMKSPVLNGGSIGNYYNYYQYSNLRSKTKYTGKNLDDYFLYFASQNPTYGGKDIKTSVLYPSLLEDGTVEQNGQYFINSQNNYGMNALMIYAMALHESGYGTSGYAINRNNLFGYGAVDVNPDDAYTYASLEDGINAQVGINLRYYLDYSNFNNNNSLFYASNIGNKGAGIGTRYASDPWWSVKIASIAFRIDRYSGLVDFNEKQLAILSSTSRSLFKEKELQNVAYTVDNRASNYPIFIESKYANSYYTQSTNPISNGSLITSSTKGLVTYDWSNSILYLKSDQVMISNTPKTPITDLNPPQLEIDTVMNYISSFNWSGDLLEIKGMAALRNTNMSLNVVTHTLKITSNLDSTITYNFPLEFDTPLYEIKLDNGFDYSSAWFKGSIDISSLPIGYYKLEVITTSGITSGKFDITNTSSTPVPSLKTIGDFNYRFIFNNFKRMSYELLIERGIFIPDQSPKLFSRFTSFGLITEFNIQSNSENRDLLSIKGIALMQHVNQGLTNNVSHKLLLVDDNGTQYIYDLSTLNSTSNVISDPNFDYSNTWYEGINLDITDLPIGKYRMFSIVSNSEYKDVVELINYAFITVTETQTSNSLYSISVNNSFRKRFELTIQK